MIKVLDIGGLDVKTAGLLLNPANEIHSNIFHLRPLLSNLGQLLPDLNQSSLTQSASSTIAIFSFPLSSFAFAGDPRLSLGRNA
jgi:hypothetical protein